MTSIEPQQQLEFLSNIQRLLGEGQFTATYKYALLLAIADICVEDGEDSGAPFEIGTRKIAEKFISYYWPQVRPYAGNVLRQNTGNMPAVISALGRVAERGIVGLNELKRDAASWTVLVRDVDRVVREMPLWKLQTVGGVALEFLYENRGRGDSIQLRPGVMFCLRRFHELVTDLVRGAWVRYVRRFNGQVLGESSDLDQFLFGAERAPLDKYLPILREVQDARCLYCEREVVPGSAHIDHFIPWSRYPIDLGHNFVLAHAACNESKAEHLAALVHLRRWIERNRMAAEYLRERFDMGFIVHNAESSERISRWAYSQAGISSSPRPASRMILLESPLRACTVQIQSWPGLPKPVIGIKKDKDSAYIRAAIQTGRHGFQFLSAPLSMASTFLLGSRKPFAHEPGAFRGME